MPEVSGFGIPDAARDVKVPAALGPAMEAFDPMYRSEDADTMPQQHVAVTTSIFRRSKPAAAPVPAEGSEDEDTMPWERPLLREQARAPRLTLRQVGRIDSQHHRTWSGSGGRRPSPHPWRLRGHGPGGSP